MDRVVIKFGVCNITIAKYKTADAKNRCINGPLNQANSLLFGKPNSKSRITKETKQNETRFL